MSRRAAAGDSTVCPQRPPDTKATSGMAASSGIVFAEALLGRDGRVSAQPGAWYPEEVLSLNRVEASLRRAGIDVTKTDHDRVGSASVR